MRLDKTSNPAFSDYFWHDDHSDDTKMSVKGVVIKSLFCLLLIVIITIGVWKLFVSGASIKWYTSGGMLSAIVISILISVRQHWAEYLVPLYAIAKGLFLGGISSYAHAKFPNLPYQAIGVTIFTFVTVLILYQTRVIVVTKKLRSVIVTSAASIFLVYVISWILGIFGIRSFVWSTSWVAILFNVIAAIVASLTLLLDFEYIERHKDQAPKSKEWMATWGLLVSLVWLYAEALRLLRKLAIRF